MAVLPPPSQRAWFPSHIHHLRDGISNVNDFLNCLLGLGQGFWYRGESKEYENPCSPTFARDYKEEDCQFLHPVYRNENKEVKLTFFLKEEEREIEKFKKSHPNDRFFTSMNMGPDDPGWISYAQHYYYEVRIPTRLLDVSTDPLVALYFASSKNKDQDGFVFIHTSTSKDIESGNYRTLFDTFTADARAYYDQGILDGSFNSVYQRQQSAGMDIPLLYKLQTPNERILAQRGAFIAKASPFVSYQGNTIVLKIMGGKGKDQILKELNVLNINDQILFPK